MGLNAPLLIAMKHGLRGKDVIGISDPPRKKTDLPEISVPRTRLRLRIAVSGLRFSLGFYG